MSLDLSFNGKPDKRYAKLLNETAEKIIADYNQVIRGVSVKNATNIDWWVSSPATRNAFTSPVFHYLCCLSLIKYLEKKDESLPEIVTDSRAFRKIVERFVVSKGRKIRIRLKLSLREKIKEIVKPIYHAFQVPVVHLAQYFLTRNRAPIEKLSRVFPLILIDTFVLPEYVDQDRYYPGLLDCVNEDEKKHIFFVPFLHGFRIWKYCDAIKKLRNRKTSLIKEDFLKPIDYLYALGYVFRIKRIIVEGCRFEGFDVTPLIKEEIRGLRGYYSTFAALLNFYLVKRFKEAGIQIRLVIDWFENHVTDKGFNAGFRKYYPEVISKGYQGGITSPYFLCMYPTEEEMDAKVIPHQIAVIGEDLIERTRQFCPDLDVRVAPAFRFQGVWQKREYRPDDNLFTILVALPIMLNEGKQILKILAPAASHTDDSVRYWIKVHPAVSIEEAKKSLDGRWPDNFEIVGGEFNERVERSNLLISNASSACFEALAKNIPVVIIGNKYGLAHNAVPTFTKKEIFKLCFEPDEVSKAIEYYRNKSCEEIRSIGEKIKKAYFEPVTENGVKRFLELGSGMV